MKFDPENLTLKFASAHEIEQFHAQLTLLLRHALTEASKTVEDGAQARVISQSILRECAAVTRAINTLRTGLPRKKSCAVPAPPEPQPSAAPVGEASGDGEEEKER